MDRQHFHIRKKPEISLSECFNDNGLTKNKQTKKNQVWFVKKTPLVPLRKQKYPNEPMRIYSKSNQTAQSAGKKE